MSTVRQENRYRLLVRRQTDAMIAHLIPATPARGPRQPLNHPDPNATRKQVRSWMRGEASEHDTATELAEACSAALDLPPGAMDDPDHWIWDEAASAIDRKEGGAA